MHNDLIMTAKCAGSAYLSSSCPPATGRDSESLNGEVLSSESGSPRRPGPGRPGQPASECHWQLQAAAQLRWRVGPDRRRRHLHRDGHGPIMQYPGLRSPR
jgi:hypothetical protein